MSITWESREPSDVIRKFGKSSMAAEPVKAGEGSGDWPVSPAALSRHPLTDGRFGAEQPLPRDNGRPAFMDYVYWASWALTGFLALVLAASVAKAIRYGVITDIINWMLGR